MGEREEGRGERGEEFVERWSERDWKGNNKRRRRLAEEEGDDEEDDEEEEEEKSR